MTAKHKTHISHVDLDKAFANIRNYSGARTDRKVFKIISAEANDEGVVRLTTHMSDLLYRVSGADDIFNSDGMSNSLYRLVRKGIIKGASYSFDDCGYPHGTITIAPAYMLNTDTRRRRHARGCRTCDSSPTPQVNAAPSHENADNIGGEIESLTKLSERLDKLEKKANPLKDIDVMPPAVVDEGTSVSKHDMHVINMQCSLIISILIGTVGIGVLAGCIWRFC